MPCPPCSDRDEALQRPLFGEDLFLFVGGLAAGGARLAVEKVGAKIATPRVIGSFPHYLQTGERLGAKVFDIPTNIWNTMSDAARWVANKKFLDRGIKEGAEFIMASPRNLIREGSHLAKEVEYLLDQGYRWAEHGWSLIAK